MNDTQNLGSLIKRQRTRIGLTLPALATKSGVSTAHLSCIEKARRYPSVNVLRKIAKPLGLDEKELLPTVKKKSTKKRKIDSFPSPTFKSTVITIGVIFSRKKYLFAMSGIFANYEDMP